MGQMSAKCALRGVGKIRSFHLPSAMPNEPDVSKVCTVRVGQLRSFHLRTAMPNEPDVSEVYTARGRTAKVLPLTLYNAEWARCQRGVHGEEWGD